MKFGVFDHMDSSGRPAGQQYEERLTLAEAYDRHGFHAYHVAEHHGTPLGLAPSPGIFLSAVAQRTKRLRFGPLVYSLPLYNPVRLIDEICMLDQMSGGRLELGVGRGVSPIEVGFMGVDPAAGPRQFPEALQVIKLGLQSEALHFDGEFYRFDGVPMVLEPVQRPHPPLWYGISRAPTTHWAALEGASFVTFAPPDTARGIVEQYKTEWQGFGRPLESLPLMGVQRHVVLAPSEARARSAATRAYRRWRMHMSHLWDRHNIPFPLKLAADLDSAIDEGAAFAGTADAFQRYVAEQMELTGANYFVCDLAFGDLTLEEAMQTVELIGREVMPGFAG